MHDPLRNCPETITRNLNCNGSAQAFPQRATVSITTALLTFVLLFASSLNSQTQLNAQEPLKYAKWRELCLATPTNKTLQGRMPTAAQLPIKDFSVVESQAKQLALQFAKSNLANVELWLGDKPKKDEFFDVNRTYYTRPPIPFQPFAQKLDVEPGSKLVFHGDFHGDIQSLIASLDWLNKNGDLDGFKIKGDKTYLVFLGDYVDRGSYGVEVLYTLMRLKAANPQQVLMARGNHEDFNMTATYGFLREGQMKYGRKFNPVPLWRNYDFLPVVIYLGVGENYVQCNHGGMEPGFDPKPLLAADGPVRYQLLGELKQKTFMKQNPSWLAGASPEGKRMASEKLADFVPKSPVAPASIGFMWNDFSVFKDDPPIEFNPGRLAFLHGQTSTAFLLDKASSKQARLRAVFRAHQHSSLPNPMMHRLIVSLGAFRHWQQTDSVAKADTPRSDLASIVETSPKRSIPQDSVWTFNVSPDSVYGSGNGYAFDTIGVVDTAEDFADWRLTVVNLPIR